MKDYLIKSLIRQNTLRVYVIKATNLVKEVQQRQQLDNNATKILGESLIATLLLSTSLLKNNELLTTRLSTNGKVKMIVADGNAQGQVKGYLQNYNLNNLTLNQSLGNSGNLKVTRDQHLADPFTGTVGLISSQLALNYAYYLTKSEQIPSAVALSVQCNQQNQLVSAGGFLIQALPKAPQTTINQVSQQIQSLSSINELFKVTNSPEQILQKIVPTANPKILQKLPVEFYCQCSKQHFLQLLKGLPQAELLSMAKSPTATEVICKFCGQHYQFTKEDFRQIINKK